MIHSGLGQLTDGVLGEKGSLEEAASLLRDSARHAVGGYSWVGWKNESLRPVEIHFFFDTLRSVEAVRVDEHPVDDEAGLGHITRVVMECRVANATRRAFVFEELSATEALEMRPSKKCVGDNVRLSITFHKKWLALGEVSFVSNVALEEGGENAFEEHAHALNTPRELSDDEFREREDEDPQIDIFEETEKRPFPTNNEPIGDDWEARYLGVAIGVLVTVIVLLLIVVVVILYRDRKSRHKVTRRHSSVSADRSEISIYKARLFGTGKRKRASWKEKFDVGNGQRTDLSDEGALSTLPHQQPTNHAGGGSNLHRIHHHHHAIYSEPIFTLDNKAAAAATAAAGGDEFSGRTKKERSEP